ncbi:MAG: glycosyltransferase [Clostridium sp.]
MEISIICPLYNAENYIENLHKSLNNQVVDNEDKVSIIYALTESKDKTEEYLINNKLNYKKIHKEDFSHSYTRESMAYEFGKDIIVFISQDIYPKNDMWLKNLISPIKSGEAEASFSRQICKYNNIEKYTREFNYQDESRISSKDKIKELGLYTFFYSDASSAVKGEVYKELKAYDGKKLLINEDMYFAEKLISNGFRIKYCADSEIYHSHDFKLLDLYKRYFDTGVFFATNQKFSNYSGNGNGISMVKYILKRSIEDKNIKVIFRVIPDFAARFIGSTLGKKYSKLNDKIILKSTLNKAYWYETKERGL